MGKGKKDKEGSGDQRTGSFLFFTETPVLRKTWEVRVFLMCRSCMLTLSLICDTVGALQLLHLDGIGCMTAVYQHNL